MAMRSFLVSLCAPSENKLVGLYYRIETCASNCLHQQVNKRKELAGTWRAVPASKSWLYEVEDKDLVDGRMLLLAAGKKNKMLIRVE
eukprot:624859-Pelagomonas_calceolata.AAC.13